LVSIYRREGLIQNYVAAGFSLRRHSLESLCYQILLWAPWENGSFKMNFSRGSAIIGF
jgi:hypothetical protein